MSSLKTIGLATVWGLAAGAVGGLYGAIVALLEAYVDGYGDDFVFVIPVGVMYGALSGR